MDKSRHLQLIEFVEDYMRALNTLNEEAYVNVYTENCIVRDPYDKAEFVGEEGLRNFFKGMIQTWHYF
jgi:ketosteroid isomerase-like protein